MPRALLEAIAILTLIATLVTPFDRLSWLIELFSHFKLQYLAAALSCAALFLLVRRWFWAVTMLAAATINMVYILPWALPPSPTLAAGAGRSIKVLLANVYLRNRRGEALLRLVETEAPDVLVVLEVTALWGERLGGLETLLPHRLVHVRNDPFGIALYSRWPLIDQQLVSFAPDLPPSILARLDVDGHEVAVIASHPPPPESRAWWAARNRQLAALADAARSITVPVILVGDLNITMWSSQYDQLERGTDLRNVRRGFGVLPTWPTELLPAMIPLDHCLVSNGFKVANVRTGPRIGSDHLPLLVDLRL